MRFLPLLTNVIAALSMKSLNSLPTEICISNFDVLNAAQSELVNAETTMQQSYNNTCHVQRTCVVEAQSDVATTTRNYIYLVSESYTDLATACDSISPGKGNSVCLVSNEIRTSAGMRTIEAYKPVCFPAACSMTQDNVRLVDPSPGNCDPNDASDDCEVLSTTVECPVTRVPSDSGTCIADADDIRKDETMSSSLDKISRSMTRACLGILFGEQNDSCSVSSTVEAKLNHDYSSFVNDNESHREYEDVCFEEEGRSCTISAEFLNKESESFLSLNSHYNFTHYPVCLPESCVQDGVILEDLAMKILEDRVDCNSDRGICEKSVSNLSCKNNPRFSSVPSATPSTLSSLVPTESPTSARPTSSPSFSRSSSQPTAYDFSSISPSTNSTRAPTVLLSAIPSSARSSLPSDFASSASPTKTETIAPTAARSTYSASLEEKNDTTTSSGSSNVAVQRVAVSIVACGILWFVV